MSIDSIREAMDKAIDYLSQHPEKAQSTDTPAVATSEGGLRFRVEGSNGATLTTDMVSAVGGGDSAPSPGWILRAALASCDATLIAMRAAQEGVELTTLEVTVDSESNDYGLLGIDDLVPAGPLSVRTQVRIAANGAPPEQLRSIVNWAEAHSPVPDAVRRAVPSTIEVEVV